VGYGTSGGPKGLGTFNTSPSTAADLNQLVTLIALMGNLRVGVDSARTALSGGGLYDGLLWYSTDTDMLWAYNGSAWVRVFSSGSPFAVSTGTITLTGMTTATTKTAAVTFPSGRFNVAPNVQVTADSAAPDNVRVSKSAVSASGFTVAGNRADSGTTLTIDWVAIQMTSSSAAG
jgi:hypothetical protein